MAATPESRATRKLSAAGFCLNLVGGERTTGRSSKTNSPSHFRNSGPARRDRREPKISGPGGASLVRSPPAETRYVLWMQLQRFFANFRVADHGGVGRRWSALHVVRAHTLIAGGKGCSQHLINASTVFWQCSTRIEAIGSIPKRAYQL